jgi:nucleoid DNA-binding protein
MTKSELIARLAERFPQLVAKDAEFAVKMILDAMTDALSRGDRIEIRGFGSFALNYRPPRVRAQSQVRREGAGAGEVCSAFQGRQGIARTRRS